MGGYPLSEEEVKMLLRMREDIKKKIERLEEEVMDLQKALEQIDALIVRGGFKRPSPAKEEVTAEEVAAEAIPLRAQDGTLLATLYVGERDLEVSLSEELNFTLDIPPFQSFLLNRVLSGMRSSDEEKISRGEITPGEALSYQVSAEGNKIMGLTIQNFGGERRLREIRSTLRWTLEKMYEKIIPSQG